MKVIAQCSKPEDAHLVRLRLEAGGVEAFIQDENMVSTYWLYSNAVGGIRVEVNDEDFEMARKILDLPPIESSIIPCPFCHSSNTRMMELSVWGAVALVLGFLLPSPSRKAYCMDCRKSFEVKTDSSN